MTAFLLILLALGGCADALDTGVLPAPPVDTAWIGAGALVETFPADAGPLPCEQDLVLEPGELTLGAAGAGAAVVHGCAVGVGVACDAALLALADPELREGDVVGVRLADGAPASGEGVCLLRWTTGETTAVLELVVRW